MAPPLPKKGDPLTKELDEFRSQARQGRRLLEPGWFLDLAYYMSMQWLVWDGSQLSKPELGASQITVTENRIVGVVRTELAKMTKSRPVFTVTPNTGDSQDANAAEMGERVMRYLWKHLNMNDHRLTALEWSRVVCAGFLKCYWDNTIGTPQQVLIGPDGQVLTDAQAGGKPLRGDQQMADMLSQKLGTQVRVKNIAQGDIKVEVRSPFQMFVDPLVDTFEDAEKLLEESVKSPEYVWRRYQKDLKPDTPANPGMIEARLMGAMTGQASGGYMGVRIREYWCKPCKKWPNGVKVTYAQNQILDMDEKPFDCQPYVMFTGVPVPGRLWPMSVVNPLRGPQTELNKTLSQMAENRNRVGNPTIMIPRQGPIDVDKVMESFASPGGIYFWEGLDPNTRPTYLEAPPLPDYVPNTLDRTVKSIEDISGQHEVTNASVPPGITAASAITLLQEADDTRLGLAMQDHENQLGRFGQKLLKLAANFYTDPRIMSIGGEDAAYEFFEFKGAMLRGNTHVEVQAGSAFPQSTAAKQAQLTDWLRMIAQMGIQPSPRQLSQYLRDQGLGATDKLVEEFNSTETQANRENVLIMQGVDLPINPQDDDEGHIANHEDWERQPRFFAQPPEIQQLHQKHTQLHRDREQQQQQQQMENELALAGKLPPTLTQAAFQQEQQLSNIQGLQQMLQQDQGQQQQQAGQAQQQGYQQAQQEQQQRQAAEAHQMQLAQMQQQMQHAAEQHQQKINQGDEQHQARMRAQQQQQQRGGPNGRQ